jgi:hypothetical protein
MWSKVFYACMQQFECGNYGNNQGEKRKDLQKKSFLISVPGADQEQN